MNPFRQIQAADPDWTPNCVFDIGANVGQTVHLIRRVWPDVRVLAFEPVSTTFAELEANTKGDAAVERHRLAFGSRPGQARMRALPRNTMNRILHHPQGGRVEEVEVVTGDGFCVARGIDRLDVLKIDTEGHDLEVLAGFRNMLADRRITYVEAECAIAPDNAMHVPFTRIADFMFSFGYGLFNLNSGSRNNVSRRRRDRGIWYGNAIFVAERWPEDAIYF